MTQTHRNQRLILGVTKKKPMTTMSGRYVMAFLMVLSLIGISSSVLPVRADVRAVQVEQTVHAVPSVRSTQPVASVEADVVSEAIGQRKDLLKRRAIISFRTGSGGKVVGTWGVLLRDHPSWIVFAKSQDGRVEATVSAERIEEELRAFPSGKLPESRPCTVLSAWTDEQGVSRVQTDCIAGPGYAYDLHILSDAMASALSSGTIRADVLVRENPPAVATGEGHQPLTLLATGRSSFQGSGIGRKANVRKGLNEQLHNVWIPADATFSFNKVLGGKITTSAGWQMALTIFNGKDLISAPGGGICQVSTTLYRAALLAGLPITKQKNHSLYVSYYEAHGVGQDATVFPGQQDLEFVNDTGNPLLIQAWSDGDEATVNILGIPDGRETVLTGPYFTSNAPEDLLVNGRSVKKNEIVWLRSVKKGLSAAPEQEVRVARYQSIPKSLPKRWEVTTIRNRPGDAVAAVDDLVAKE
ncbi:MAG: VanW family protein [Candidatus Peribacteraceae bacterium]|nr:VanW family protein [Candidatus Peribacteraceae bacterium]